ncbi:uncharacterized protein LOC131022689 [Salvia miltiorrhiza]|uniref:uncharacterized protein LOC131022689 n=1 Tax=Salvia miltiorrhiza TaxID=226208 RepID=UPI0025AB7D38|nr:uncharacterized protein LOC131022689 [Salvia miltiorrhiza]
MKTQNFSGGYEFALANELGRANLKESKDPRDEGSSEPQPQPHLERRKHIVDVNIKCYFCSRPTQTGGEHQISNFPCGLVFGYSCMEDKLPNENKTCPMCGEKHAEFDVTKLDIIPDQMMK